MVKIRPLREGDEMEWRRRGVGRMLVEAGEAWARSQGCAEMRSDTREEYPLSPAAHRGLEDVIVQRTIHFRKELSQAV